MNLWCRFTKTGGAAACLASVLSLGMVVAEPASAQPRHGTALANFGSAPASSYARALARWVMQSGDHQGGSFVVVDKKQAHVYVFNSRGQLQGAAPALLGSALGDDPVAGIGDRPLSKILPHERTTPSGRFVAGLGHNIHNQAILWVDYDQAISLHPVRSVNAAERRLERLTSPSVHDNRISYGCINVPLSFFQKVVVPAFRTGPGIVYVLPEIRPIREVFAFLEIRPLQEVLALGPSSD